MRKTISILSEFLSLFFVNLYLPFDEALNKQKERQQENKKKRRRKKSEFKF